ncbi:MAG: ROK family protein, partial [Candidatus Omnitrophica bacterium]|nr:ROK family protein [Candidatus Omnitrophota bacterium]
MGAQVEIQNLSIPHETEGLDEILALAESFIPFKDRTSRTLTDLREYVKTAEPNGLKHKRADGKSYYRTTSEQQILWVTPPARSEVRSGVSDARLPALLLSLQDAAKQRGLTTVAQRAAELHAQLSTDSPAEAAKTAARQFLFENRDIDRMPVLLKLEDVREFLDGRPHAVWYARYDGGDETVEYVNPAFAQVFQTTQSEILQKKTYREINGPEAPVEKFKADDRQAMEDGFLIGREGEPLVTVVKVAFQDGVLGFFMPATMEGEASFDNLEPELLEILRFVRPDLFPDSTSRSEVRSQATAGEPWRPAKSVEEIRARLPSLISKNFMRVRFRGAPTHTTGPSVIHRREYSPIAFVRSHKPLPEKSARLTLEKLSKALDWMTEFFGESTVVQVFNADMSSYDPASQTLIRRIAYWLLVKMDALLSRVGVHVLETWVAKIPRDQAAFTQTLFAFRTMGFAHSANISESENTIYTRLNDWTSEGFLNWKELRRLWIKDPAFILELLSMMQTAAETKAEMWDLFGPEHPKVFNQEVDEGVSYERDLETFTDLILKKMENFKINADTRTVWDHEIDTQIRREDVRRVLFWMAKNSYSFDLKGVHDWYQGNLENFLAAVSFANKNLNLESIHWMPFAALTAFNGGALYQTMVFIQFLQENFPGADLSSNASMSKTFASQVTSDIRWSQEQQFFLSRYDSDGFPLRSEVRAAGMQAIQSQLKGSANALVWFKALNDHQAADAQDKVNVTLQIARGIQMKVPMLRSVLSDPALQEFAYRYLAVWAYNLSIIYGTSFVAAGVEGEPDLIDSARLKSLLTGQGALANVREAVTKGDENPLGIKNYANAGKVVDIKPIAQLSTDEQAVKPVSLDVQLLTQVPGAYLGIDVGGGSAKLTVIQNGAVVHLPDDLRVILTVLYEGDGKTAIFETPEAYVQRMSDRVSAIATYLKTSHGIQTLDGVGINTPGAADFEENRMETLGQIPVPEKKNWNQAQTQQVGRDLPRKIADALKISHEHVRIRNDMDGVLPGVASVLAKAKPEFWQQTGGNFAFDWMGTGHGFQFALGGVPINAPTEAGHMIFDFAARDGKVYDTEAFTSIPSMLRWARKMAQQKKITWPEIDGDYLKPLADAVFSEEQDPVSQAKKEIAQKVFERFAKNYAANLALRYHMVQATGHGSATEILLGGGIARGKTGEFLKTLTLQALVEHGLDSKMNITVITDDEIEAAGVDPDDVGPIGAAYFIQSVLASRKAKELEDQQRVEWELLAKTFVVGDAAKELLTRLGIEESQWSEMDRYLLRYGGPVQKMLFQLRAIDPVSFPLMPITLHFANAQENYQPKWLSAQQAIYLKVDPLALAGMKDGDLDSEAQSTEALQIKAQNFLASAIGGILSPLSIDQKVRRIAESDTG